MNNPWPIVDNISSTSDVLPFLYETSESLKQNYEGKLQSQTAEIKYTFKGLRETVSLISGISSLVEKPKDDPEYEEMKDIEKDRKAAYVANHDYKYEIYNDHLYYKLFTINIPEFYPVTLKAAAGTLDKEEKEVIINDLDELEEVFSNIVNSDKVRSIIKKMLL